MSKLTIKLEKDGIEKLLKSPEMLSFVTSEAHKQWDSHTHHHVKPFIGYDRAKAILYLNTDRYPG